MTPSPPPPPPTGIIRTFFKKNKFFNYFLYRESYCCVKLTACLAVPAIIIGTLL
jgi:hypothetical protein